MRLNFVSVTDPTRVMGWIERDDSGNVTCDKFGRQMLNSGWSPKHTTDGAIFARYAGGWSVASRVSVVEALSSSSRSPVTGEKPR